MEIISLPTIDLNVQIKGDIAMVADCSATCIQSVSWKQIRQALKGNV